MQILNVPHIKLYYSFKIEVNSNEQAINSDNQVDGILHASWLSHDSSGSIAKALFHSLQSGKSMHCPVRQWPTAAIYKHQQHKSPSQLKIAYTKSAPFNKTNLKLPQGWNTQLNSHDKCMQTIPPTCSHSTHSCCNCHGPHGHTFTFHTCSQSASASTAITVTKANLHSTLH